MEHFNSGIEAANWFNETFGDLTVNVKFTTSLRGTVSPFRVQKLIVDVSLPSGVEPLPGEHKLKKSFSTATHVHALTIKIKAHLLKIKEYVSACVEYTSKMNQAKMLELQEQEKLDVLIQAKKDRLKATSEARQAMFEAVSSMVGNIGTIESAYADQYLNLKLNSNDNVNVRLEFDNDRVYIPEIALNLTSTKEGLQNLQSILTKIAEVVKQ